MDGVYLGLTGWAYPEWVGRFYASGTRPIDFLAAYARAFRCTEVNGTYYAAPLREDVARWDRATAAEFRFSVKLPRSIVAEKKLRDVEEDTSDFLARLAPLHTSGKLASVLAVMPPSFRHEPHVADLERFLGAWPRDVRLAVELRHSSWWRDETYDLLRAHDATLVWSVSEHGRTPAERTSGSVYMRFVGDRALDLVTARWDRTRRDQAAEIDRWREPLQRAMKEAETTWIIANNHFTGYAPEAAQRLADALAIRQPDLAAAARDARQRSLW